jgi:group I intron endonuclease
MAHFAYLIKNTVNGKHYAGSTRDIERRIKTHLGGNSNSSSLNDDVLKFGKDAFEVILFEQSSLEESKSKERELMKEFNVIIPNGYNKSKGSSGGATPWLGKSLPKEMRKKISEKQTGRKDSAEAKVNKLAASTKRWQDPNEHKKQSEATYRAWETRRLRKLQNTFNDLTV